MPAADVIKEIRQKLGITQEELARSISVAYHTVNRWENNKSTPNQMARTLLIDFCRKSNIEQRIIDDVSIIQ